jgi:hypothetical protein
MEKNLFTNRNSHGDFVREALVGTCLQDEPVYIATAFFTEHDILRNISSRSGRVRLIVRLGFPTSPKALQDAMNDPNVDVRYFTGPSFHTKLYMFADRIAFVGSANLTGAAATTNQEVLVALPSDDTRLQDLALLFGEYWNQAAVLNDEALADYRKLYLQKQNIETDIDKLDQLVMDKLGRIEFANIDRDKRKQSKENLFVESYRKTYQKAVSAFARIRDVYLQFGVRKVPEEELPLRLEIDSFFSFVRDEFTKGDSWLETPLGWGAVRQQAVRLCIDEWNKTPWFHLEDEIANTNYPRLIKAFATEASIKAADDDQLFEALLTLHSFHDRLRFHPGGLVGLRQAFMESNPPEKIRSSLAYLVHGPGDLIERMANLIYSSEYKLEQFGPANVQELVGWMNREDLPVINGRTTKVLRYFGFDVRQMSA